LRPKVEAARSAFASFYAVVKEKILDAQKMEITTADVYSASREVSSTLKDLSDVSYAAMNDAVEQRLSQVIEVFGNISSGKYDNEIRQNGHDEAAQVLTALGEMQGKLRTQIENER